MFGATALSQVSPDIDEVTLRDLTGAQEALQPEMIMASFFVELLRLHDHATLIHCSSFSQCFPLFNLTSDDPPLFASGVFLKPPFLELTLVLALAGILLATCPTKQTPRTVLL